MEKEEIDPEMSDLERIARKCEDLISCDNSDCEIKGDYWKCYNGNEKHCKIYLNHLIKYER